MFFIPVAISPVLDTMAHFLSPRAVAEFSRCAWPMPWRQGMGRVLREISATERGD